MGTETPAQIKKENWVYILVEFTNQKTGEKLKCEFVVISDKSCDMLEGFRACVRDEYGETYPRSDVYDLEQLAGEIRRGEVLCCLARGEDGDPVSSLALTPCVGLRGVPELTMHVVRRRYRGFGVGAVLTKSLLELPQTKSFCAVTAHSVTFHVMAQHQTIRCGFVPTGFLFLIHNNSILKHSFDVDGCVKQSFAVGVFPESKSHAGELFLPPEHRDFICKLYRRLGVEFTEGRGTPGSGKTDFHSNNDELHHTMTAEIFHCGGDLPAIADEMLAAARLPDQTINMLLDMNDPAAAWGYESLRQRGFIFTGVHPLCENGEFMLMHHCMDMTVPFDKLCIDDGYKEVFEYIRDAASGSPESCVTVKYPKMTGAM